MVQRMTVTIYMTTSAYEGEPDKPTRQTCIDERVPDCRKPSSINGVVAGPLQDY
jgi:hypothetical protein